MLTANAERDTAPQIGISEMLVPQLISAQARQRGHQIALATDADELHYGDLERRANQLANHLRSLGAGPEMLVGICLERSPEFVIAALAIMKCGAAYLPMDSAHPAERLRFILKDAGAPLLITNTVFRWSFHGFTCQSY